MGKQLAWALVDAVCPHPETQTQTETRTRTLSSHYHMASWAPLGT
jgi:hypothetical protein